jgi:hypothetical protein
MGYGSSDFLHTFNPLRAFDLPRFPIARPLVQPEQRFFDLGDRDRVLAAFELAVLVELDPLQRAVQYAMAECSGGEG